MLLYQKGEGGKNTLYKVLNNYLYNNIVHANNINTYWTLWNNIYYMYVFYIYEKEVKKIIKV